jgi:hypothetical protein
MTTTPWYRLPRPVHPAFLDENRKPIVPPLGLLDVQRKDPRTIQLKDILTFDRASPGPFPVVPTITLGGIIKLWAMYGNNQFGDCGPASIGHWTAGARGSVTWHEGKPLGRSPSLEDVYALYTAVTVAQGGPPFNPETGAGDSGVDMLTMLTVLRTIVLETIDQIGAFAEVDTTDVALCDWASCAYGGLIQAYSLPTICQDGRPWTFTPPNLTAPQYVPGGWGGHATDEANNNQRGTMADPTWGELMPASRGFKAAYRTQAFVLISKDWIEVDGLAPSHLNVTKLRALLTQITAAPAPEAALS